MSSASPSRVLVSLTYATDRSLPDVGEIIVVCLSENLFGPGSIIESGRTVPSRSTRHNYCHAVVLGFSVDSDVHFTVLPMPAYSCVDPTSGLSSTRWLLGQPKDYQQRHIPVPYEEGPTLMPEFSTPARFGDPLFIGGWKDVRPSWVLAVPQVADLKRTTIFKRFQPSVTLSEDEVRRLKEYVISTPVFSSTGTMSPFPPGDGDGNTEGPGVSPTGGEAVLSSGILPGQPGRSNHNGGAEPPGSRSLALQALYANDAVKRAFTDFDRRFIAVDSYSDDDSDDDDEIWEDNMEPMTFVRHYAAGNPVMERMVQEHDQKMRKRLDQGIMNWVAGVQTETF